MEVTELGGASEWLEEEEPIQHENYIPQSSGSDDLIVDKSFRNSFEISSPVNADHVFFRRRDSGVEQPSVSMSNDDTIADNEVMHSRETPANHPTITRLFASLRQQLPVAQPFNTARGAAASNAALVRPPPVNDRDEVVSEGDDAEVAVERLKMSLHSVVKARGITASSPEPARSNNSRIPVIKQQRQNPGPANISVEVRVPKKPANARTEETVSEAITKEIEAANIPPSMPQASSKILAAWKAKRSVLKGDGDALESGEVPTSTFPTHNVDNSVVDSLDESWASKARNAGSSKHVATSVYQTAEPRDNTHVMVKAPVAGVTRTHVVPAPSPPRDKELVAALQQKALALEQELEKVAQQKAELAEQEEKLKRQSHVLDNERKQLLAEKSELQAIRKTEHENIEKLKQELQDLIHKEKQKLVQQKRAAEVAVFSAEKKENAELEKLRQEIKALKADNAALELKYKSAMDRHRALNQKKDAEIESLRSQLAAYEAERIAQNFTAAQPQRPASRALSKRRESYKADTDSDRGVSHTGEAHYNGINESVVTVTHTAFKENAISTTESALRQVTHTIHTAPKEVLTPTDEFRLHLSLRMPISELEKSAVTGLTPISTVIGESGKKELTYANGVKCIVFKNGTEKETHPDSVQLIRYNNGDIKRDVILPNGKTIEMYLVRESGVIHTTFTNCEAFDFPNGQVELHWPSGDIEVLFSNGQYSRKHKFEVS